MKSPHSQFDRRSALKALGLGSAAGALGAFGNQAHANSHESEPHPKVGGMDPVKITKVRSILTAPYGINLVIVKVETEIGRAHVRTPVTEKSRMPSSA